MDNLQMQIDEILRTNDTNQRCAIYQNFHQYFSATMAKNLQVNGNSIKQLATILRNDCLIEQGDINEMARNLLELILNSHLFDEEGELVFVEIIMGGDFDRNMKELIRKTLKQRILSIIKNDGPLSMILEDENRLKMFQLVINDVCRDLPKDVCVKFLIHKIIPMMFNRNTNEVLRNHAIDLGLHIVDHVKLEDVEEKSQILKLIADVYIDFIDKERQQDYQNWHKLWVFLLKFLHVRLHGKVTVANRLLKVVEQALRNGSDQRLQAYTCWRELIDNRCLDSKGVGKSLKLILTPLTMRVSRSSHVMVERFKTFVYLLNKLQEKSLLCLKEFLEFSVGPIQDTIDLDISHKSPLVYELPFKTISVVITFIGHRHDEGTECVECEELTLEQPIINEENFKQFDSLLINSALGCCVALKDYNHKLRNNVMRCLWKSIFHLITNSPNDCREQCYTQMNKILTNLYEKRTQDNYYYQLINTICEAGANYRIVINDELSKTLFKIILHLACYETATITNVMVDFISGYDNYSNNNEIQQCLLDYYLNDVLLIDFNLFCEGWLKIVEFNIDLSLENRLKILNWCTINLNKFKNEEDPCLKWMEYYRKYFQTDDEQYLVLQNLEKLFLNNPLINSNIIQILKTIDLNSNFTSKDSNLKFLTIIESILGFPTLVNDNLQTVVAIISTYFDKNHNIYQLNDTSILSKLCNCIKNIVNIHKEFSVLLNLHKFCESLDKDLLLLFANNLTTFIETLLLNDDDTVITYATKLMQLFEIQTNTTMPEKNLDNKQTNKEIKTSKKPTNDPPLTRSSRMVAKVLEKQQFKHINDESSSDFVKIDSEVRFEPNKLNEHQKEVLTRRRDDIPALYQDLSQSQEIQPNEESTNENSGQNNTVICKNPPINTDINRCIATITSDSNNVEKSAGESLSVQILNTFTSEVKVKKPKKPRNGPFTSRDYLRRKRPKNKPKSKSPQQIDINREATQIDVTNIENKQRKSEVKQVENISKQNDGNPEEKRLLRTRKSLSYSTDSLRSLEPVLDKKEPGKVKVGSKEKRLRKRESLQLNDDYTWCVIHNDKVAKTNKIDDQSNDSSANFNTTPTESRLDKVKLKNNDKQIERIRISKKILNKSFDSINDFHVNQKERKQRKRKVNSLDNVKVDNLESQDIIESSQETTIATLPNRPPPQQQATNLLNNENNNDLNGGTQTTDTATCTSEIKSLTPNLQLDLPTKEQLTQLDVEISLMNTATLTPTTSDIPTESEQNLASSPITCNTPDRTVEFLNNTSDISPINSIIINDNNNDENSIKAVSYVGGERSRKMLQMATSTPTATTTTTATPTTPIPKQTARNRFKLGTIMSPSVNLKKTKKTQQKDENLEVLTFTRNLPNNNQVPGSSILKRKTQSDEFLPNAKRKRVNFSDPATTSKKIIIKDPDEFNGETNNTNQAIFSDLEIMNEIQEHIAMAIGKATEKGLDSQQIGILIREQFKNNNIEMNECPSKFSLLKYLKKLTDREAANLLSDYFCSLNQTNLDEIKKIIKETNKNHEKIFEIFLLELSDDGSDPKEVSKKIDEQIEKMSNNQDNKDSDVDDIIKEKICKWKTDKFIDLFEIFVKQLNNVDERNQFLIDLMQRSSNNLTDSKFINNHFEIIQHFVNKFVS